MLIHENSDAKPSYYLTSPASLEGERGFRIWSRYKVNRYTTKSVTDLQTPTFSLKIKLIVISLGAALGLVVAIVVATFLSRPNGRTSFSSVDELRASMSQRSAVDVDNSGSVSLRSIVEPHPSDDIIYTLRPNLRVKFQQVPVVTNSFGMRGPEIKLEKPADTIRIAFLGDSFTFGWGVEEDQIFVRVLERLLNETIGANRRVEILNFGVPGYSTFQEVALYREKVAPFKPDLVVIYFVSNDFGLPFLIGDGGDGNLTGVVGWVKGIYQRGSTEERAKLRDLELRADANKALLALDADLAREGIPLFLALNPGKGTSAVKAKLWALRSPHHFKTIGMMKSFNALVEERQIDRKTLSLPTDPHPSAVKHQLLAEILAVNLKPEIANMQPAS